MSSGAQSRHRDAGHSGHGSDQPQHNAGSPNSLNSKSSRSNSKPNWFVRSFRSVFGYRKTTLTFLVFLTVFASVFLSYLDNSLEWSVPLPTSQHEKQLLRNSWSHLQKIASHEHTYASSGNDEVHDYLEHQLRLLVKQKPYIEFDNDLNNTNTVMYSVKYLDYDLVSYYESNNLLVRINGSNPELPALLLSAHFDSVPSSYGVTDDGMGIASLLGVLDHYAHKNTSQPSRTIIFNFNNNEEFGLYGANAFLSHPWALQVKYFLNLEGTGAGGKAVLFRGTDYGVVSQFSNVRYPFAASIFQQGFNNKLIHSETDYAVYKDKGELRGIDVAFYRPRDLYHTAGDNIKNVNQRSLWHMLANSLDYTNAFVEGLIDLDDDKSGSSNRDFAAFSSFHNVFVSFPISKLIVVNIVLLVIAPIIALPLLFFISHFKKQWNFNFTNVIKLPLSFIFSSVLLSFLTDVFIIPSNSFLINNSKSSLVATLFSLFLLLNYFFLNGFNFVFKVFKGHFHDEKLISLLETSLLVWVLLVWSTSKLSKNVIGDDHTGEHLITLIFILQASATILGLLGWTIKSSQKKNPTPESEPLLSREDRHYGSDGHDEHESGDESSSMSVISKASLHQADDHIKRSFSYDWLIQFLIVVPLSSIIIYNNGFLLLEGISKSIQESLDAQNFIYKLVQGVVIAWAIPFLPFVFKLNRIVVVVLILAFLQGLFIIGSKDPFDQSNPLKLRFIQTVDLNTQNAPNTVLVYGRDLDLVENILNDLPSVKSHDVSVAREDIGDGNLRYQFPGLTPHLIANSTNPHDYLQIDVLKNASSGKNSPFGLLSGELLIKAPKNRNCKIDFNVTESLAKLMSGPKKSPVKTFIVYNDGNSDVFSAGTPEGFSRDSKGNYVFKNLDGISQVVLNKLDWDKPYRVGFQWAPEFVEASDVNVKRLGVNVECYWADLSPVAEEQNHISTEELVAKDRIPAFREVLHYSPNYISWANKERGLVSVTKFVEV